MRKAPHLPCVLLLLLAPAAGADTITLTNGRVIEADRTWYQGSQLLYEKDGGVYGLPRKLVQKLDQREAPAPSADPDVLRARQRLAAGDPVEAVRLLLLARGRDPRSVPVLQALSEAYLAIGDPRKAREAAEEATRLDPRGARSLALLGDALVVLEDRPGAEAAYRKSLQLHGDAEVERKLGEVASAPPASAPGAQFRIRYEGSINEPLGVAVLAVLGDAYDEYSKRLGFHPDAPVTVVLETEEAFQDARPPEWAAGVNDGTIRLPVRGVDRPIPRLRAVLRHELAHSFVAWKTGGNCPTWLHEGIAQWLEGGDPTRDDGVVAAAATAGKLLPLLSLEAPFASLSEADAALAYAESLSAVAYVVRTHGEPAVVRILNALGDQLPAEEALPVALALSYPELQRAWEQSLRPPAARRD